MKLTIKRLSIFGLALILAMGKMWGQSEDDLIHEGVRAFQARDFAQARKLFAIAVERNPSARNLDYLALSESSAGDVDQAILHFRRSIELGNRSASVHYSLGLAYLKGHQVSFGLRELQQALEIDPELKGARYALAVALLDAGRPTEAVPHLIEATKQSPCDEAIWVNLVRGQFESGDIQGAMYTIAHATDAMPGKLQLMVTLGALCYSHRQFQRARHLLENASELNPDDPDIKLLLAKASLEAGEPIEALAVLKVIHPTQGRPGEIAFARGIALALTSRLDEAGAEFASAVEADPRSVRYLIAQAWVDQLKKNHTKALGVLEKARELDLSTPIIPFRMAVSFLLLGRYKEAVRSCQEAISLGPRYDPARLLLGIAELEQQDFDAAQRAIGEAVAIKPEAAIYRRELGVALYKAGKLQSAQKELDRALALDSTAAQTYYWRARVLAGLGNQQGAIADLETVLALEPSITSAYSELGELYSRTGQPQKAQEVLAKQKEVQEATSADDRDRFLLELSDPLL